MQKINKAVRVSFSGGLIGLLAGSHRGKIDKVLNRENSEGWNLAEIIDDNPNLIYSVLKVLLLMFTLGLWTLASGYVFIFEKPR